MPLGRWFAADAVVVQCGADALADDPMSRLCLSNRALWSAVAELSTLAPRVLVLGGGGYNPWSVGRCWAGVWATLNGIDPDVPVTAKPKKILRGSPGPGGRARTPEHWFTTLADASSPGPVRDEIRRIVDTVMRREWRTRRSNALHLRGSPVATGSWLPRSPEFSPSSCCWLRPDRDRFTPRRSSAPGV